MDYIILILLIFSATGLAWQAAFRKTKRQWELLTDIDVLLMVEKSIRGKIRHPIRWYAEVNNKYNRSHDEKKDYNH